MTLRFKKVIFGVSCSPFLLNATIYHHLLQYQPEDPPFVHKFLRSIYVDDLVSGASTTDEAFHLYSKSKACLKEGGFNLQRFVSNSPQLQKKIDLAEGVPVVKSCNNVSVEDESYSRATLGANQGKATEAEQNACDASSKAYAAVVHLLAEFCGTVNVQFLVSKNRVAPKGHTIPRLQLLSVLLLSRLLVTVTKARHWWVS